MCSSDLEGYFIILSSELTESIARRLRIYVMRSDVNVEPLDDCVVAGLSDSELSDSAVATLPLPGEERMLVIVNQQLAVTGNHELAQEWKAGDLARGICWLGGASTAQFLPQMLGFGELGAINFRKGCYPGQEIVARTHYLGKLKRFPRVLKTAQAIGAMPMEKVTLLSGDDRFEAVVADTVESEAKGCYLFTVVRMDPELEVDKIEFDGQSIKPEAAD